MTARKVVARDQVTAREVLDATMSERDFQAAVIAFAKWHGWSVYHTYRSDRSEPGYPDLTMVRNGQLVCAELKSTKGRLTSEQVDWLARLGLVPGVVAEMWRPADWERVEEVLR